MATWKAENSMLTQVGVEILNKVKAGVGSITVTRVVAGSGRVPASKLFQQAQLSGSTKPMTISQKDVMETGSEISIYIRNDDFTESFNLNQIGIYVSHSDYLEEQLYHISQCEEVGYDVIPALDETPVTFGYSLFLEHGNSSSINITVDPQGMIDNQTFNEFKVVNEARHQAMEDTFNAFKSGIREGKLVTVDANNNLIASGKNIVTGYPLSVTDAITHRALSLSIEGKSTQESTPRPSSPVYTQDTKVISIHNSDGTTQKTISLPSTIVLKSVGEYEDTIEWDGAKWWKVQRIAEIVADGVNSRFGVASHGNNPTYSRGSISLNSTTSAIRNGLVGSPVITSHGNTTNPSVTDEFFGFYENNFICIHILGTVFGSTGAQGTSERETAINNWLKAQNSAGTPVKLWYVLKTPVVTEISLTEVLDMYANQTQISCNFEGNEPNLRLGYALDTTDDTIMYILKSLTRKSEVLTANTFAIATLE